MYGNEDASVVLKPDEARPNEALPLICKEDGEDAGGEAADEYSEAGEIPPGLYELLRGS